MCIERVVWVLLAQATRFILNILYALVLYHCKSSCTGVNDI